MKWRLFEIIVLCLRGMFIFLDKLFKEVYKGYDYVGLC